MKLFTLAAAMTIAIGGGHAVLACSGQETDPSLGAPNGGDGSSPRDPAEAGTTAPAVDAAAPPSAHPDAGCLQNAACVGEGSCASNDGTAYHHCQCSAGHQACGDIVAAPPTTCVIGGACSAATTCAVDDGSVVSRCSCVAGAWSCQSITNPSGTDCSAANPSSCAFSRPSADATEWLDCAGRSTSGAAYGFVCTAPDPQSLQKSGVSFVAECPAVAPAENASCGHGPSLACQCKTSSGDPCVCRCDSNGFGQKWSCY